MGCARNYRSGNSTQSAIRGNLENDVRQLDGEIDRKCCICIHAKAGDDSRRKEGRIIDNEVKGPVKPRRSGTLV